MISRTLAHAEQVVVDQALGHLEVLQALRLLHLVLQLRCVSEQTISQHTDLHVAQHQAGNIIKVPRPARMSHTQS